MQGCLGYFNGDHADTQASDNNAERCVEIGHDGPVRYRFTAEPSYHVDESRAEDAAKGLYPRGILMNITNPNVSIFFLAFLPQFVDRQVNNASLQMLALGGAFIVATLLAFGFLAWMSGRVGTRIGRSLPAQRWMSRMEGGIFAGMEIKLVTTH
jgi:threonine/homoserine/homoserine lactone efflux protein